MESKIGVYVIRSLHYFVRLMVLLGVVFVILMLTNTLDRTTGESLSDIFLSLNGAIILALVVLLAGAYPQLSFTTIIVKANLKGDMDAIVESFEAFGYSQTKAKGNVVVFRAKSNMKRFNLRYDDAITVTGQGDYISLEGLKREVIRVDTKLDAVLNRDKTE